jgi:hypothetical protein
MQICASVCIWWQITLIFAGFVISVQFVAISCRSLLGRILGHDWAGFWAAYFSDCGTPEARV